MAASGKRKASSQEISSFCSQVGLILDAGLPLYDGMETLADAAKDSEYAEQYRAVSEEVNATGSLYEALKKDEQWPDYLVEMTGIGEQTGQLERVMNGLADSYDRETRIRSAIVSAVTYPLVLGVMVLLIVLIMIWKVLPVFRRVLNSMGTDLTGSGRILMNAGSAIGWIVLVLVGIVLLAVIIGAVMMRGSKRDKVIGIVRKLFPAVRKISLKLNASRVASVLSMMLGSGFPTAEAFRLMPSILSDQETIDKVEGIRKNLDEGGSFADAVTESGLYDGLHDRMIRMGVAAGREEQVLDKLAGIYEEEAETGISRMVSIIEPTLIALLAVVIGAILLSVMLPMAGILSGML